MNTLLAPAKLTKIGDSISFQITVTSDKQIASIRNAINEAKTLLLSFHDPQGRFYTAENLGTAVRKKAATEIFAGLIAVMK
ncbi:MAG: hypothetical protein A2836_03280 [Candidatus Taylorbacteria bacterium RIFCSPHIGHO2_01_FULL_45_63]|uniref:Uncharacterized protein n=1 Tax=Candidatus Taylorbacteria bacterium RIFCSPHIGHO2_02_FULL_45_35 TaxID=1802311 RepID=A0A1G2MNC3_9BACT|nr:MAG: hypothetical protein A2836_03280 [Candidatus Taylorbacteria bacterium RIFCSPHIGHO2_01_FULL_45_63]OHA25400.1 MAG: hypothetical protein A3D56_01280 [Candidatus Taylorbacteria bacterium RIFCSPHIGHO2_02_FULL_45_35]OHA33586.1 MAG: hypothetical protein A3A22_03140 [Candidatus Taylorbacteria bacterium RIFCSPLOWO2_01_FULL_45_34b]